MMMYCLQWEIVSPGPNITFGSMCRSDKEGLIMRWKASKQKCPKSLPTDYLIQKQNGGVVCSCTLFKLHLDLCHNLLSVHTIHVRLWAEDFLTADCAASQGCWGLRRAGVYGFVQGSLLREKRWWQKLLIVTVCVNAGGCCRSKSSLLCSGSKSSHLDETRQKCQYS